MEFNYHKLKNWSFPESQYTYTEKDTMLYALSLGYGADPLDAKELQFVYEKNLKAVPTMAVILGSPGFWIQHPETGVNWVQTLHGEQSVILHSPLPSAGTVIGQTRVKNITDKGAGKGALLEFETRVSHQRTKELLATVRQVYYCRGNGGYSESGQPSDAMTPANTAIPLAPADFTCDLPTRPAMALLYRLSSDLNPLHADPAVAQEAGFARPILHGLATFGVAGHALLKTCCGYDPARLKAIRTRFTAAVYPGETIRTEIWQRGTELFFRARALERDTIILNNGYAEIA